MLGRIFHKFGNARIGRLYVAHLVDGGIQAPAQPQVVCDWMSNFASGRISTRGFSLSSITQMPRMKLIEKVIDDKEEAFEEEMGKIIKKDAKYADRKLWLEGGCNWRQVHMTKEPSRANPYPSFTGAFVRIDESPISPVYECDHLLEAADAGDADLVRSLLVKGADVHGGFERDTTALHLATMSNHSKVAKVLIEYGADVNRIDGFGATPVHQAVIRGHMDVLRLLIKNGGSVRDVDPRGNSPVQVAVAANFLKVVKLLVQSGADINQVKEVDMDDCEEIGEDLYVGTPLHFAVAYKNKKMAALLLSLGADPNLTDSLGYTPSEFARTVEDKSLAELFQTKLSG